MTLRLPILCLALLACTGCFNVDVYAPHGQEVMLVSAGKELPVKRQYRTWFVVWGATRLDDTMPAEIVAREQFTEARFVVEDNIPDALHGILYTILLPIGLVPQTIIVQASRAPGK